MVSKKIVAAAVILIAIGVVAGVALYYNDAYHRLTFELKSVGLASIGVTALQTNFGLAIGNPGPLPIYVPNGNFEVYINDVHVGTGSFGSLTIAGNSQSLITIPVTFNPTEVPSVVYGLITGGGTVTVTIAGSANLGLFSVPFNTTLYEASFR